MTTTKHQLTSKACRRIIETTQRQKITKIMTTKEGMMRAKEIMLAKTTMRLTRRMLAATQTTMRLTTMLLTIAMMMMKTRRKRNTNILTMMPRKRRRTTMTTTTRKRRRFLKEALMSFQPRLEKRLQPSVLPLFFRRL